MLAPGGTLKGFEYFTENTEKVNEDASKKADDLPVMASANAQEEASDDGHDNEFDKMKKQVNRYFLELNPTIKCARCK